jgi:ribosomal protein L33
MHERGKAGEGVLFECQTCEKKIYVVKKNLGKNF